MNKDKLWYVIGEAFKLIIAMLIGWQLCYYKCEPIIQGQKALIEQALESHKQAVEQINASQRVIDALLNKLIEITTDKEVATTERKFYHGK